MEPEYLREVIAVNVRRYAARRHLTVPDLSDRSGVSRAALYRLLRCETSVTSDTLAKLALALSVDVHRLLIDRSKRTGSER